MWGAGGGGGGRRWGFRPSMLTQIPWSQITWSKKSHSAGYGFLHGKAAREGRRCAVWGCEEGKREV